ncbi:MAG: LPS export ABC transporter permease LptG [Silicimonas sp.]|jgi:lipopolysaccharide export system permease protein|nr:LPS export ABC transporter permease LptG [Silicimonas sp.]
MTLHLYFGRRFLKSFFSVLFIFFAILLLTGLIDQIRRFGGNDDAGFGTMMLLALLSVPSSLYRILPLIMILATLALFLGLARSSELVVTRASGRSAMTSLAAPILLSLILGMLAVAIGNPIVAATQKQREAMTTRISGVASTLSVSEEGLWLRQGNKDEQTVIRAERANLDGTTLFGVTFLGFSSDGTPTYRIEAREAALVEGAWTIKDAKEWRFDTNALIPEVDSFETPALSLASNLTRSQILDSFGTPSAIPIWELPGFIARLEAAGFSARVHRTFFHRELALPVLLAAMVLVGAGFTMRHTRFGRTGVMVLAALGLGFTLYFIQNFAAILGENGQIPIVLAAWGPPVAALLLPLGLLLHLEDG